MQKTFGVHPLVPYFITICSVVSEMKPADEQTGPLCYAFSSCKECEKAITIRLSERGCGVQGKLASVGSINNCL